MITDWIFFYFGFDPVLSNS